MGEQSQKDTGLALASRLVHSDDGISTHRAVAPAMHVSTTFRYSDNPDLLQPEVYVDVTISHSYVNTKTKADSP